jgi:hypothetical protein
MHSAKDDDFGRSRGWEDLRNCPATSDHGDLVIAQTDLLLEKHAQLRRRLGGAKKSATEHDTSEKACLEHGRLGVSLSLVRQDQNDSLPILPSRKQEAEPCYATSGRGQSPRQYQGCFGTHYVLHHDQVTGLRGSVVGFRSDHQPKHLQLGGYIQLALAPVQHDLAQVGCPVFRGEGP